MQKQDKIDHLGEIAISTSVLVVITEIIHFMITKSDPNYLVNQSLFFGYIAGNVFAILVGFIILVLLILFLRKNYVSQFAVICLLSGGIVNLIDRWRYGGAIDYLNIGNIPTFNLPDIFLTMAVVIFLIENSLSFQKRNRS